MQELLNNFGVNGFLLTAQAVNFLIVLYLLKRFAFGPILKLLNDRKKTIAESLRNAEETKKILKKSEEKEKEILQKAQSQAQEIISDARKEAIKIREENEINTKKQVERIIEDSNSKIKEQTKEAEKQLASRVTRLAINILEKSLKGLFSDKEQKEVVDKAVKRLKV